MNRPLLRLTLGMLALFALADLIWLPFSELTVDPGTVRAVGAVIATLLIIAGGCALVMRRLEGDDSRIAEILRRAAKGTVHVSLAGTALMLATPLMVVNNYLMMAVGLPFEDAALAAADRALGFDWLGFLAFVDARPWMAALMVVVYGSSLTQMLGVVFVLGALSRTRALQEFVALYLVTGAMVSLIAMGVPAIGAYAYWQPDPAMHDLLTGAGTVHLAHLEALRAGTFTQDFGPLEIASSVGLVTFPSFHTVLAIIVPFAFRGIPALFWPLALLNALVLVSTLPEGGHFLIDVFAGAAVALAAIAVVRWIGDGAQFGLSKNAPRAHVASAAER